MPPFKGTIIEESLENKEILSKLKIISTQIEKVNEKHKTSWLKQWTLHKVIIPENEAKNTAEEISRSLDKKHRSSWYADYKNDKCHYIIFRNKIFFIDRTSKEEYKKATNYGLKLGIPEYQLDFLKDVKTNEKNA